MENINVDNTEVVEQTPQPQLSEREQIEQEALARYKESQLTADERAEGVPEGFNEDGTPQEELIDGKFKSQEDLLKAYKELEKKMSQPNEQKEPEPTTSTTENEEPTNTSPVNVEKYGQEFVENGSLSEKSYGELEKLGFSKQDVDTYIATRQQMGEQFSESIYSRAGGQEGYQELITWASENLSPDMINEYNTALNRLDSKRASELVDFMAYKKGGTQPQQPRRLEGTGDGTSGVQPFNDKNDWQRAMTNRLYGKDPKYTKMVDARYLTSRRKGIL